MFSVVIRWFICQQVLYPLFFVSLTQMSLLQRSCASIMNPVRKQLVPSKPPPASTSHDALLLDHLGGDKAEEEEGGYLLVEEDPFVIGQEVKTGRRRVARKRRRKPTEDEEEEVEIDRQLDQSLESKSKQHNLTSVNIRNIIHVSGFTSLLSIVTFF